MRTVWEEDGEARSVTAPLSLIVSAFAPVDRRAPRAHARAAHATPATPTLLLVDLGRGKNRLGGSALAQVYGKVGAEPPDLDNPALLAGFFAAVQELRARRTCCSPTTIAPTAACS